MKVVQSREGFFSGTANHHSAALTESQGLQGLSLVWWVGVTDLEVTHSVQLTALESICYTTLTQCLNISPLIPLLLIDTGINYSSVDNYEILWPRNAVGTSVNCLGKLTACGFVFLSTNNQSIILSVPAGHFALLSCVGIHSLERRIPADFGVLPSSLQQHTCQDLKLYTWRCECSWTHNLSQCSTAKALNEQMRTNWIEPESRLCQPRPIVHYHCKLFFGLPCADEL